VMRRGLVIFVAKYCSIKVSIPDVIMSNLQKTSWKPGPGSVVLLVTIAAALFTLVIVLAPVLSSSAPRFVLGVRMVCSPLCHQEPSRTLYMGGGPVAVCARCTGLYAGGVLGLLGGGLLGAWRHKAPPALFFLLVTPTLLDAVSPWLGFSGLENFPRAVVSLPAGAACGWFLAYAVGDLFRPRTPVHSEERP